MQLDFSLLENIGAVADQETRPPEADQMEGSAKVKIERQQDILQKASQAWKERGEAIKNSELYRTQILKGISSGESDRALFLLAIECIYSLTGDKAFYTQIKKKYIEK